MEYHCQEGVARGNYLDLAERSQQILKWIVQQVLQTSPLRKERYQPAEVQRQHCEIKRCPSLSIPFHWFFEAREVDFQISQKVRYATEDGPEITAQVLED